MDAYGNGRIAVIDEMIIWCEKEMEKQRQKSNIEGDARSITRGGMIKGFKKVIIKLREKKLATENYEE